VINKEFEKLYVMNAPKWALERDPDGSYKYHATQSAFVLFQHQQVELDKLQKRIDGAVKVLETVDLNTTRKAVKILMGGEQP